MKVTINENGTVDTIENVKLIKKTFDGEYWLCNSVSGSSASVMKVIDVDSLSGVEDE